MENKRKIDNLTLAARRIASFLFPPRCVCCGEFITDKNPENDCLCDACMSDFVTSVRAECTLCGKSVAVCECVTDALRYAGIDASYASFAYDKANRKCAASRVIYKLKDGKNTDVTRFCAHILASRIEKALLASGRSADGFTVTYAPRRNRAIREKGSDHMAKTARLAAKALGLPFESILVNRASGAQKKKDALSRLESADRSIRLKKNIRGRIAGKRYIVVDDILTSGATLAACTSRLNERGAEDIIVVTLAKTL